MKNRIIINIILAFFIMTSYLNAETVFFDSKNIKVEEDGNMIFATKGTAKIPSKNLIIKGDKFVYNKKTSELTVFDNVKYFDKQQDIIIESQKLIYNKIENTIFSQSDTKIDIENKYNILSSNVIYDRNSMKISSKNQTLVDDKNFNSFDFNLGLLFDINKEVISSEKVLVTDKNLNKYFFENSKINLKINEIAGKGLYIDFENSYFGNENNDPILKGKSAISNNDNTKVYKTVFSTCNKENKNCRGWELESDLFTHNKIKKLFEYRKSWFKVFDKKVFYVPYFNHPDPTIKRKTGLLTPFYKGSDNLGSSISTPYFYAISNSKDFTFKPRIYFNNEYLFHSEYRQAFKNADLQADFSFNREEKGTSTHLFTDINGTFDENTDFELKIENVSNDNYLKIHDIKDYTPIINSHSTLSSFFKIDRTIDEDTNLSSSIRIYDDLSENDSDKYQYIFPDFNFSKSLDLDDSYQGNFKFLSSGFQKVYDTNKHEVLINNDFNYDSFNFISSKGFVSDYSLLLKNFNTYSKNSTVYENKNDHEIFGTILLKSEYPLRKDLSKSVNYLKPILQARISPTNGKNISSSFTRIEYDNVFSPNRIGRTDMVEKGNSVTFGIEFEKQNLNNEKILGFNLANVLKDKKNLDLPKVSKLDQTRSDIIGNLSYNFNDFVEFDYNFSFDRDLDFSNYDAISTKFVMKKLSSTFDYITENHELGDTEVIKNDTEFNFTDEHSIQFSGTKDLKEDDTQIYKLAYEYETDCLLASFQYQKKFYRDEDLLPDESLFFLVRFIPFAELRGSASSIFEKKDEFK